MTPPPAIVHQVKALLSAGLNRPRKGNDVGDHPPITPMRAASEGELGESVGTGEGFKTNH